MKEYVPEIVIAIIGSGALSALISGVFAIATERRKRVSNLQTGMQMLMFCHLKEMCLNAIEAGKITAGDLHDIIMLHDAYHKLGGNGYLDSLINQIKKLPIEGGANN